MHAIEGFGLRLRHQDALLRHDAQPGLLDHGVDGAGEVAGGRVRLDNRKCTLAGHDGPDAVAGELRGLYRRSPRPSSPAGAGRLIRARLCGDLVAMAWFS